MEDVVDVFIEVLAEREDISLRGFGKFVIKYIRTSGSLPKWLNNTGEAEGTIENYPIVKFVPSVNLKVAIGTQTAVKRDTRVGSRRSPYSYRPRGSSSDAEQKEGNDGDAGI